MAGFFVKFNTTVMDAIKTLGSTYQTQYATGIMSMMVGCVTLYILWVGYSALAGKKKTPMDDLVWDLARFAMIITFITNAGGYLTATTGALQGLKDGFAGGTSVWSTLDTLWDSTQTLADKVFELDKSTYVKAEGAIGAALVWTGSIALMFTSSVVFLTADLTMTFMLLTAPIFIFCLMFGFLRPMFNNWLQLIFSSILTILFASLVIKLAIGFQVEIVGQVTKQATDKNLMTMGAMGAVVGLLSAALVTIAAGLATKLAGAGAEGAVQGMAMAGLINGGYAAGRGLKAGGKIATPPDLRLSPHGGAAAGGVTKSTAKERRDAAVEFMKAYNASQERK